MTYLATVVGKQAVTSMPSTAHLFRCSKSGSAAFCEIKEVGTDMSYCATVDFSEINATYHNVHNGVHDSRKKQEVAALSEQV